MKEHLLEQQEINKGNTTFIVYKVRWLILSIFVLSGVANALVLLSWSPISDKASDYWGNIGATAVNLLAVSFQIMYIPGTALSAKTMKVTNLRTTMILGGLLTSVGCVIRWIGGFGRDNGKFTPVFSYVCVLLGTIVVATAQPFYLNMPAKIAASWFAVQERDIATTLCSLANPLGSALGSIIPAMFVTGSGHDVKGVSFLLLVQMIVALIGLVFTYFLFQSNPKTPPSNSAMLMTSNQDETDNEETDVWTEVKNLLSKTEYVKLLIGFTIALGNLNALAALLNQLPGDYSNGAAGNLGAVLIMCGFLGAFITGFILDSTKAYRTILKSSYGVAVLAWIFFASNCRKDNYAVLLTSSALLGFILLPIIPSTIVNSVECAYPSPEDIAVGLLYVCANTLAIPMTFIGQILLTADSFGPAPLFPYGLWVIITMSIGAIPVLLYKGQYLRLEQDEQDNA